MYKNLFALFTSLKFYYYYYNLILVNTKRLYDNNFFKNSISPMNSFNNNFFSQSHWDFSNKQSWYYIGLNGLLFTFKTKQFFFKYLTSNFLFSKQNSMFNITSVSCSSEKNSKNFWKYRYINVLLNFCDWSKLYRNSVIKSKMLFLFGASHPIQNIKFRSLRKYEFDAYNDDSIQFNVDISENSDLNYSKKMLLSELFFFNNSIEYALDVNNDFLILFVIRVFSSSSIFNSNRFLFNAPLIFNFYTFLFYPYSYKNDHFLLENIEDSRVVSDHFFDKSIHGLSNKINFNISYVSNIKYALSIKNNSSLTSYYYFLSLFNIFDLIWLYRKKNVIRY